MRRRIAVVTGSRAEYGLLKWIIKDLEKENSIEVLLYVTGSHLSALHGGTVDEIQRDGLSGFKRISVIDENELVAPMGAVCGQAVIAFTSAFSQDKPDAVVILGDRYEIFAVAISAAFLNIPIFHIHGGEKTIGAIDDSVRHAISKFANVHFVSTDRYARRLQQMGEASNRIHCFGAPGLDSMRRIGLMTPNEVRKALNLELKSKVIMVSFHPETRTNDSPAILINLLEVLGELSLKHQIIFTGQNSDDGADILKRMVKEFCERTTNTYFFESMGHELFLSCLAMSKCIVGNSSSGIIEAPSLGVGVINIGLRQAGREMADSVICCSGMSKLELKQAFSKVFSRRYIEQIEETQNPYDRGLDASKSIVKVIKEVSLENLCLKEFIDFKR